MRLLNGFILFLGFVGLNKVFANSDSSRIEILQQKGNIEILSKISNSLHWLSYDSSFAIAYRALNELEKNLMYKMTDKIHLKFISDLNEYETFQSNHSSNQRVSQELANDVFFPIYTSCEYFDMVKQIRYSVANQFINEYLFGISLKDKFQLVQQEDVPKWLYLGFCNYFSCGIQQSEFQKFIYLNNIKKFNNINNINSGNEQLFGTILWYLFEKEKGKEINSAFWYLIKYANSFEKTFEYQFGIKFNLWLKERITEIEKAQSPRIPKAEFTFRPQNINGGIIIETSIDDNLTGLLLSSNKFVYDIYFKNNQRISPLLTIPKLGLYPIFELNTPKILFTINKAYTCYIENQYWILSEFSINSDGEINLKSKRNLTRIPSACKVLKLLKTVNGVVLIYRKLSAVYQYSLLKNETRLLFNMIPESQFEDFSTSSALQIAFIKQRSFLNGRMKIETLGFELDQSLKLIYDDTSSKINDEIKSLVIESNDRISFLKSKERFQSIDFLTFYTDKKAVKSTNNKGIFYSQHLNYGNENIIESFFYNGNWSLNRLTPNSELLNGDTLKLNFYSFDSLKSETINLKKSIQSADSIYFISDFDNKTQIRRTRKNLFYNLKITRNYFRDWLYIKELKFEFSNKDINVPYSFNVPLIETYNSIITPMLGGKIYSSNQKQILQFLAFSNVNRRRVGFNIEHTLLDTKSEIHQSFIYRLRQYENGNELALNRDRYFQYKIGLFKNLNGYKFGISANIVSNQTINLFTTYRGIDYPLFTNLISGLILSSEFNPFERFVNSSFQMKIKGELLPQVISNNSLNNSIKSFSYAHLGMHFRSKIGILDIHGKLEAYYSIGSQKMLCYIGGTNGLFSNSSYYSNNIKDQLLKEFYPLQLQTGFVRGFPIGSRAGSNSIVMQTDFDLTIFHLFRSRVIEKSFLKNFKLFTFTDIGTAFNGNSTSDPSNSYNTQIFQTPNYTLSVSANRNPWLFSTGMGIKLTIWDYQFRIENAHGFKENKWQSPFTSISLGKNF